MGETSVRARSLSVTELAMPPTNLDTPRNLAAPLLHKNQISIGHGWTRMKTDRTKEPFFLIRVPPCLSVANNFSLVLARRRAHLHSVRLGVWSLVALALLLAACRSSPPRAPVKGEAYVGPAT